MNCEKFNQHIHDYFIDQTLDYKIITEIEEHIFECKECSKTYEIYQHLHDKDNKKKILEKLLIASALEKIKISYSGTEQKIKGFHDKIEIKIPKPTQISVEFDGMPIWQLEASGADIYQGLTGVSASHPEEQETQKFEADGFIIEISKGSDAGTLIIKQKVR